MPSMTRVVYLPVNSLVSSAGFLYVPKMINICTKAMHQEDWWTRSWALYAIINVVVLIGHGILLPLEGFIDSLNLRAVTLAFIYDINAAMICLLPQGRPRRPDTLNAFSQRLKCADRRSKACRQEQEHSNAVLDSTVAPSSLHFVAIKNHCFTPDSLLAHGIVI